MRADCRLVPWHATRVTPPAFVVTVVRSGAVVWPRMEPLSALPKAYRRLSGWQDSWTLGMDNDQLKPRNASSSDIWSSNATYLSYRGGVRYMYNSNSTRRQSPISSSLRQNQSEPLCKYTYTFQYQHHGFQYKLRPRRRRQRFRRLHGNPELPRRMLEERQARQSSPGRSRPRR